MKILHILYQSLPQISGSSIRSRDILMTQHKIGLEVLAVTSPFQNSKNLVDVINGIKYIRTNSSRNYVISDTTKGLLFRLKKFFRIFSFTKELKGLIKSEKPDILHAHAMFFCAIPALYLGRKLNIPVVYEIRSLWMLKKDKSKRKFHTGIIEKLLLDLELFLMKKASKVIAINENLKSFLVKSGINSEKIEVIRNAVNTDLINAQKIKIRKSFSNRTINFGYIGTLTPHEGIHLLIESFLSYQCKFPASKLIIYGNGIETENIKNLAKQSNDILFAGAIKPDQIFKAFDKIDIIVNPRLSNKLTNSVTPLKPLEAMAYERLVIGSDVGGINELISNGFNGFIFKAENVIDLENVMIKASKINEENRNIIITNALKYVEGNRSWLANARKYKQIYKNLYDGTN